jgi:hypothetical protein
MITFSKAVDYLLENDYLAVINGEKVITNKFLREFKPIPKERLEQLFADSPDVISREAIFKKFCEDAEIPYKGTFTDSGKQYTIRQYSPGIADRLIKIIKSVPNYKILVEATKLYYKSNGFKLILSNYIDKQVWKDEYERYEKAVQSNQVSRLNAASSGGNPWED